jgi:hypothetical protein
MALSKRPRAFMVLGLIVSATLQSDESHRRKHLGLRTTIHKRRAKGVLWLREFDDDILFFFQMGSL